MLSLPNELLGCVVDECPFAATIALGQACTVTRTAVDARKQRVAVQCGCPVPTTAEVRAFWTALNEMDNGRWTMNNWQWRWGLDNGQCSIPPTPPPETHGKNVMQSRQEALRKHDAVIKHRPIVKYLAALGAFGEVPAGWTGEAPSMKHGFSRRCIETAIVRCAKAAHAARAGGRGHSAWQRSNSPDVTFSDFVVAVEAACSPRFFARQFTHRQIKMVVEDLIRQGVQYIEGDEAK